jgi:hypothetical protein
MAIKVFACAEMASEDVQSYCVSAKFYANDAYAKIHDGALVVLGDLDTNDAYGTPDYNVYKATKPTAVTDDVVIVDLGGVNEATVQGNIMKIGNKLVDLEAGEGIAVRCRRLMKGDRMWLGRGLFTKAPTVGKFAGTTANDTLLTPIQEAPAGGLKLKVLASKGLTVGQSAYAEDDGYEQLYLCEVK